MIIGSAFAAVAPFASLVAGVVSAFEAAVLDFASGVVASPALAGLAAVDPAPDVESSA